MPATVVATEKMKGAGSELQVSFDDGTTYVLIKGIESLPQVGGNAEYDDTTRIDETERSYSEKLATPQEVEYVFDDLPADTDQQAFIAAATARNTLPAKHLYSNGRIASFSLELIDHYQGSAEVEGDQMAAVKGRIRSVAWSTVA